jgi:hypothetical protein
MMWAGLFLAPLAWSVDLIASYAMTEGYDTGGSKLPLFILSLVALLVALAGGGLALASWKRGARAGAIAGIAISALFVLLIAGMAFPKLLLGRGDVL